MFSLTRGTAWDSAGKLIILSEAYKICADFEMILRLIYINKISYKYIPFDCVTMRTGGASTSGIKSHKIASKEHIRALKQNGLYSNMGIESLRYIYKGTKTIIKKIFKS